MKVMRKLYKDRKKRKLERMKESKKEPKKETVNQREINTKGKK